MTNTPPLNPLRSRTEVPLVSVIVPCFNQEKYLGYTINSLLKQTYPNIEIIVVDDGSSDSTVEIAMSFGSRVSLLRQRNSGASAARNLGLSVSKGKYIQYLDGDDLLEPRKIESQVAFMETNLDVGIVYSDVRYFTDESPEARDLGPYVLNDGEPWIPVLWRASNSTIQTIIERNMLAINCALVRQSAVGHINGWNEKLLAVEDWDYWIRCANLGVKFSFQLFDESLALVRLRMGSVSTQVRRVELGQYQMRLDLSRKLLEPRARMINCQIAVSKAFALGPNGRLGRVCALFVASQGLACKLEVLVASIAESRSASRVASWFLTRILPWPIQQYLKRIRRQIGASQ